MYCWYFIILTLLTILGVFEILIDSKQKYVYYVAIVIILVCFTGLKLQGGTDLKNIKIEYETVSLQYFSDGLLEPLYVSWMLLFNAILCLPFQCFYFATALFNIGTKITLMRKIVPYVVPAALIYFIGMYMERDNDGIRQGISCSVAYVGMFYLMKKNVTKYFFYTILACFFHATSVAFFLLYPLRYLKCKDKRLAGVVGFFLTFPALKISIFDLIHRVIPIQFITDKIDRYTAAGTDEYTGETGYGIGLIFRVIILFILFALRPKIKIEEEKYYILRNGFACAIIISLVFHDYAILSHRLPYGLRELQAFIVPFFLTATNSKFKKMVIFFVIVLYIIVLLIRLIMKDTPGYYLYQSILFS